MQIKKTYEKPVILSSESLEAKAVICTKSDSASCAGALSS